MGQRPGVRVGDIDLDLRHHHKQRRGGHCPAHGGKHVFVGRQVHLFGVNGTVNWHAVADGQVGQVGAAKHFDHAQYNPARPAHHDAHPPAAAVSEGALGHEAQVIRLLTHLRHQSDTDRQCGTKQVHIKHPRSEECPAPARARKP